VSHANRFLLILAAGFLCSCGGGGGGGSEDNYAGDVWFDLERDHIDSGDLTKVSVEVASLNRSGSILKFRTSRSVRFVKSSAVLFPDRDEEMRISPDEDVATDFERYIVFFLDPDQALGGDFISLEFTVKGVSGDEDGFIEVDLDNNDGNIPDDREFRPGAARFTAQQRRSLYVEPESSEATPTPAAGTPSPTATPAT
jgi:hypothetical protein